MNLMIRQYINNVKPFISTWNTSLTSSGSNIATRISLPLKSGGIYSFRVSWGDGTNTVVKAYAAKITHTYAVAGIYKVTITGLFQGGFNFNGTNDRLKLLSISSCGSLRLNPDQTNAFNGCKNLTSFPDDAANELNKVVNGTGMLKNSGVSTLPYGVNFNLLTVGFSMFEDSDIVVLPSGVTFNSLINGNIMFFNTQIKTLPDSVTFNSLNQAFVMFANTQLETLPNDVTLSSLSIGIEMFYNTLLTSLPDGVKLNNLTDGSNMFFGVTIDKIRFSQLLVDINENNSNNGVEFGGGNSKYNASGQAAKNALIARSPSWEFVDGGFEA